jgi:hypothetical protein
MRFSRETIRRRVGVGTKLRRRLLVADTRRAGVDSPPVPTTARVSLDGFLTLGAGVGTVGWGVALFAATTPAVPTPELVSMAVWAVLVGVMVGVGVLGTPDAIQLSRPMVAWGVANGSASVASLLALFGVLPDATHVVAWGLAGSVGYGVTGRLVDGRDGSVYLTAAAFEAFTVGNALVVGGRPVHLALLGVCHVVPLVLVVGTETRRAPYLLGGAWVATLLAGLVVA